MQTLDGNAVQQVAQLARESQDIDQVIATIGDHEMSTTKLHHIDPKPTPAPPCLEVETLDALVEYLKQNRDGLELDRFVLHVVSPSRVDLLGTLEGETRDRWAYASALATDLVDGWLGRYHSQEEFVIALQERFTDEGQRDDIASIIGTIAEESRVEVEDDGVTQHVNSRGGIHLGSDKVPNPVTLYPYRIFREVPQVESRFLLRVKKNPAGGFAAALFEVDGGSWRLGALDAVAEYLVDLLQDGDEPPVVPVLR